MIRKIMRILGYIHQEDLLSWIEEDKRHNDFQQSRNARSVQSLHFHPNYEETGQLATRIMSANPYEGIVSRLANGKNEIAK